MASVYAVEVHMTKQLASGDKHESVTDTIHATMEGAEAAVRREVNEFLEAGAKQLAYNVVELNDLETWSFVINCFHLES